MGSLPDPTSPLPYRHHPDHWVKLTSRSESSYLPFAPGCLQFQVNLCRPGSGAFASVTRKSILHLGPPAPRFLSLPAFAPPRPPHASPIQRIHRPPPPLRLPRRPPRLGPRPTPHP